MPANFTIETILIALITTVAGLLAACIFPGFFAFVVATAAFVVSTAWFAR